jgi:hypothetical protein
LTKVIILYNIVNTGLGLICFSCSVNAIGAMEEKLTKIKITASGEENEPGWRTIRIKRAIEYIHKLADYHNTTDVISKIHSLHDEKGELIARWKSIPTSTERRVVNRAWLIVGDYTNVVRHQYRIKESCAA